MGEERARAFNINVELVPYIPSAQLRSLDCLYAEIVFEWERGRDFSFQGVKGLVQVLWMLKAS